MRKIIGETFDILVVGAGSAGRTLASRLSENPECSVLLLEAGRDFPDEEENPPAFLCQGSLSGEHAAGSGPPVPEYDWGFWSEPLSNERRLRLPRGKVVGGSSVTNGTVAVRGRPEDFGRWEASGAIGWGWDAVRPLYETVERELNVFTYPREIWLKRAELTVSGWLELGFRYVEDLNQPDAWDGVAGPWPRNRRNEMRLGSLNTYIRRARGRDNFTVRGHALVDKVLFSGTRAIGVRFIDAAGVHEVYADRIVLSAGAYGSAAILLRSGVGPENDLRDLGVKVVASLPVGQHLMDHPTCGMLIEVEPSYARMGWPTLAAVVRGKGFGCVPMPYDQERNIVMLGLFLANTDGPDGRIRLRSTDPTETLDINHGFQSVVDGAIFAEPFEAYRNLLQTPSFRAARARDIDEGVARRERMLMRQASAYHPAGGCLIGTVVDPDLNVLGIEGLTVADASVFPRHVTNNPNLTCFMVGEMAARRMLAKQETPLGVSA